jgi:hypothetical protein
LVRWRAPQERAEKSVRLRTIKSDVVVGLESDELAERLDKEEPGWKISGKFVSSLILIFYSMVFIADFLGCRPSFRGSARGESSVCVETIFYFLRCVIGPSRPLFIRRRNSFFYFL